jgi:UDP-glucose 4-epimerase
MPHTHNLPVDRLSGARVLITGGAGLIGSHLADSLARAGAREIVIFDNLSRGRIENLASARFQGRVNLIQGDVRDCAALAHAMQGIDFLFHLAAIRMTQCAEEPRLALEVMADGTFNVLEAAVHAKVNRVAAASSASIYGMADRFPTTEDHHPYHNTTLYGAAKVFSEGLLASFRDMYGLDYIALRPFNVYGPRMDIHGAYTEVLVRWMERIVSGKPPIIFGDGSQSMDFVFVEDVARAFLLAATSDASGEVFNIASGVETSLKQLADALLHAMESNLEIEYGPERKLTAVPRRTADVSKARARLGFQAEVNLDQGLRRLVTWWQQERQSVGAVVA